MSNDIRGTEQNDDSIAKLIGEVIGVLLIAAVISYILMFLINYVFDTHFTFWKVYATFMLVRIIINNLRRR